MNSILEEWRPVKGYEGLYEISSLGRIRSLDKEIFRNNRIYLIKGKIMIPQPSGNGYLKIVLYKCKCRKKFYIHRLVAQSFIPNLENKPCVDHINTIKNDNRVNNLRWCTVKENTNNPISIIKLSEAIKKVDKLKINKCLQNNNKEKASKKVYQYDLNGNYIRCFDSVIEAAIFLRVKTKSISNKCTSGHYAYGFLWYYKKYKKVNAHKPYRKKIAQYNKSGELVKIWESISLASKYYNNFNISLVCKGKRKTAAGFVWKYID